MSNPIRWKVSGSDADLLTQVEGDWIACDPDLDWTVVLASDYDALATKFEAMSRLEVQSRRETDEVRAWLAKTVRLLHELGWTDEAIEREIATSDAIERVTAESSAERRETDAHE